MRVLVLKCLLTRWIRQLMRIFNIAIADIVIPEEPEAPEHTLADGTYTVTSDIKSKRRCTINGRPSGQERHGYSKDGTY